MSETGGKAKTGFHFLLCEHTVCVFSERECTWAEHGLNLVDELLGHQVCKTPHAQHPAVLLAGNTFQTLILLNLVEHVSNTDGTHINTGITAHIHKCT